MQCLSAEKQQNDLCSFPGKPLNITVIRVYAPITNAEEAEIEWVYEDLQELTAEKKMSFSL